MLAFIRHLFKSCSSDSAAAPLNFEQTLTLQLEKGGQPVQTKQYGRSYLTLIV